jgi:hypothetical protein
VFEDLFDDVLILDHADFQRNATTLSDEESFVQGEGSFGRLSATGPTFPSVRNGRS